MLAAAMLHFDNDAPKVTVLQRLLPKLYRARSAIWHDGHPRIINVHMH